MDGARCGVEVSPGRTLDCRKVPDPPRCRVERFPLKDGRRISSRADGMTDLFTMAPVTSRADAPRSRSPRRWQAATRPLSLICWRRTK